MDSPNLVSIPFEIRNIIYGFLLVSDSSIELRSPFVRRYVAGTSQIARSLLLVNKQLYREGSQFLYSSNTFTIGNATDINSPCANVRGLKSFIRCAPPAYPACIRKIHFRPELSHERWYYNNRDRSRITPTYGCGKEVEWIGRQVASKFTGVQSIMIVLNSSSGVERSYPKKPSLDSDNSRIILRVLIRFLDIATLKEIRLIGRRSEENLAILDRLLEVKPDAGKIITVARSLFE